MSHERLELRACDAEVLPCLDERGARPVQRGLRCEHVEQRGRTECVALLLYAKVFLCGVDAGLLNDDALLRGTDGAELLYERLLCGEAGIPKSRIREIFIDARARSC